MKKRNRGIILSYIYFALNTILTIIMTSIIIKSVGKTDYGVYQSMTSFVAYLILLEFGTGALMSRNISLCKKDGSEEKEIKKNISTVWMLTTILAMFIVLVSFVFCGMIDSIYANSLTTQQISYGKTIFMCCAGNLLFTFLTRTLNGLTIAYERYTFGIICSIAKLLVRMFLIIIILPTSCNVIWVSIIDLMIAAITFIVYVCFISKIIKVELTYKYFDLDILKMCMPMAFAMLLQTIINTANNNVDKFLISIMMTPEDVATYSLAMTIYAAFSSIAVVTVSMYLPHIAEKIRLGIKGLQLTDEMVEPCRINVIITGLMCFGFFSIGQQFLELIYGKEYVESWIYAIILIFPSFFVMYNSVVINVVDLYNKRHIRSFILLSVTIVNVITTIIGIKYFGILGATIATGVSFLVEFFGINYFYEKALGIKVVYLFIKSYRGILMSLLIGWVASEIPQLFIHDTVVSLLVGGFTFVGVFGVLYLVIGLNDIEKSKIMIFMQKSKGSPL